MNKEEIFEELKKIIVEQLGVNEENITMQASFIDDLSADSLDIVELVMNIEEKFWIVKNKEEYFSSFSLKLLYKHMFTNLHMDDIIILL